MKLEKMNLLRALIRTIIILHLVQQLYAQKPVSRLRSPSSQHSRRLQLDTNCTLFVIETVWGDGTTSKSLECELPSSVDAPGRILQITNPLKRWLKKMPGRRTRGSISMTLSSVLTLIGATLLANSELESNAQVMHPKLLLETVTS